MHPRKEHSGRLFSAKAGGQSPNHHHLPGPGSSDADCIFFGITYGSEAF